MKYLSLLDVARSCARAAFALCLASGLAPGAQSGERVALGGGLPSSPLVELGFTSLPGYPYSELGWGARGEFGYSMSFLDGQLWVSGGREGGGTWLGAYDYDGSALGPIREDEGPGNYALLSVQGPHAGCVAIRSRESSVAGNSAVGIDLASYGQDCSLVGEARLELEHPPGLQLELWGAVAVGGDPGLCPGGPAVLTYWVGWDSGVEFRSQAGKLYFYVGAVAFPPAEAGRDSGFVGADVLQAWLNRKGLQGITPLGLSQTVVAGGAQWAMIGAGPGLETVTVCGMAPEDVAIEVTGGLLDSFKAELEYARTASGGGSFRVNLGMLGGVLFGVAVSVSAGEGRGLRVYGADGSRWFYSDETVHSAHLWISAAEQLPALLFFETEIQGGPKVVGSFVDSAGRLDLSMEKVGDVLDDGAGQSLSARFEEGSAILRIAVGGHGVFGLEGRTPIRTPWVGAAVLQLLENGLDLEDVPIEWFGL